MKIIFTIIECLLSNILKPEFIQNWRKTIWCFEICIYCILCDMYMYILYSFIIFISFCEQIFQSRSNSPNGLPL